MTVIFDSLHWFKCMSEKMKHEQADLAKRTAEQEQRTARRREKAKAATFSVPTPSFLGSMFGSSSSSSSKGNGSGGAHSAGLSGGNGNGTGGEHDEEEYEENEQTHTLQLTAKRLEAFKIQSELLSFSMSGARMFFKRNS